MIKTLSERTSHFDEFHFYFLSGFFESIYRMEDPIGILQMHDDTGIILRLICLAVAPKGYKSLEIRILCRSSQKEPFYYV